MKMTNKNHHQAGRFREGGGSSPLIFTGISITEVAAASREMPNRSLRRLIRWSRHRASRRGKITFPVRHSDGNCWEIASSTVVYVTSRIIRDAVVARDIESNGCRNCPASNVWHYIRNGGLDDPPSRNSTSRKLYSGFSTCSLGCCSSARASMISRGSCTGGGYFGSAQ